MSSILTLTGGRETSLRGRPDAPCTARPFHPDGGPEVLRGHGLVSVLWAVSDCQNSPEFELFFEFTEVQNIRGMKNLRKFQVQLLNFTREKTEAEKDYLS